MKEIVDTLLMAPDSQLDEKAKEFIRKWNAPPTAPQVLEVLDWCVWGALASEFMMRVLHMLFEGAMKQEETTQEEVEKKATWRKKPPFNG